MTTSPYTPYSASDDGREIDSFRVYCTDITAYPLLSHAQECDLSRRAHAGDKDAFDRLAACNLRLVVAIAKGYINEMWALEDCICEGNAGLLKAIERFDPDSGWKFSTYATWWVKQAILRAQDEQSSPIRTPSYVGVAIKQLRRAIVRLEEQLHREPTLEDMAGAMGWSLEHTECVYRAAQTVLSLSMPVSSAHTSAEDRTLADTLYAPEEDNLEYRASQSELRERLNDLLTLLTERERLVLALRFGLEDGEGRTLLQVGRMLHVSRERIRQIEAKALAKLRERPEVQKLREAVAS